MTSDLLKASSAEILEFINSLPVVGGGRFVSEEVQRAFIAACDREAKTPAVTPSPPPCPRCGHAVEEHSPLEGCEHGRDAMGMPAPGSCECPQTPSSMDAWRATMNGGGR